VTNQSGEQGKTNRRSAIDWLEALLSKQAQAMNLDRRDDPAQQYVNIFSEAIPPMRCCCQLVNTQVTEQCSNDGTNPWSPWSRFPKTAHLRTK